MAEQELKTSGEWSDIFNVSVIDPDGWDRTNLEQSWNELIPREEFEDRLAHSTIIDHNLFPDAPRPVRKLLAEVSTYGLDGEDEEPSREVIIGRAQQVLANPNLYRGEMGRQLILARMRALLTLVEQQH